MAFPSILSPECQHALRSIDSESSASPYEVATLISLKKPRCILPEELSFVNGLAQQGMIAMGFTDGGGEDVTRPAYASTARLTKSGEFQIYQQMKRFGFWSSDSRKIKKAARELQTKACALLKTIQETNKKKHQEAMTLPAASDSLQHA